MGVNNGEFKFVALIKLNNIIKCTFMESVMKKLLALMISGVVLAGCNNSGSQFVGTYKKDKLDKCEDSTLTIAKNGDSFIVNKVVNFPAVSLPDHSFTVPSETTEVKYIASLDNNVLSVEIPIIGKVPANLNGNILEFNDMASYTCKKYIKQ